MYLYSHMHTGMHTHTYKPQFQANKKTPGNFDLEREKGYLYINFVAGPLLNKAYGFCGC